MASTIIIKNKNTGAPSSLSAGELAINTTEGSLYYGSTGGTSVSSSFQFGAVTASVVSASGTIMGSNIIKISNTKEFQGVSTVVDADGDQHMTTNNNWYHSNHESDQKADMYEDDTSIVGDIDDGSDTLTIQKCMQGSKYIVPYACTASMWRGVITNSNNISASIALLKVSPVDESNTDLAVTVIASASVKGKGNPKMRTFNATLQNPNLGSGDLIIPVINRYNASAGTFHFNTSLSFYSD
jgi:hypothetical protein